MQTCLMKTYQVLLKYFVKKLYFLRCLFFFILMCLQAAHRALSHQTTSVAPAVSFCTSLWNQQPSFLFAPMFLSTLISFLSLFLSSLPAPSPSFHGNEEIRFLPHLNPGLHGRQELISDEFVSIHNTVYYSSIVFVLMHFDICSNKGKQQLVVTK